MAFLKRHYAVLPRAPGLDPSGRLFGCRNRRDLRNLELRGRLPDKGSVLFAASVRQYASRSKQDHIDRQYDLLSIFPFMIITLQSKTSEQIWRDEFTKKLPFAARC